jgi:uncharacterized membrane protein YoaK (UPF0700 family)
MYWQVTTAFLAYILCVYGDFSHYTWCVVLQFFVLSLLMCVGKGHTFSAIYLYSSVVVIVGVLGMSMLQCSLLVDTARDMSWRYIIGNFTVHYYLPLHYLMNPAQAKPHKYISQVMAGASMFSAFAAINNATDIYGCSFPRGIMPVVTILVTAVVFVYPYTRKIIELGLYY